MAELNDSQSDHETDADAEALGESDDVRKIKEEWTRLQVRANQQEAEELREEVKAEIDEANKLRAAAAHRDGKHPPARLPSLEQVIGKVASIPSMQIATGIGKKLPELGSTGHRLGIMADKNDIEPKAVKLEKTTFTFGADTPTQTDIKWAAPENGARFNTLHYEIEVDGGQGWAPLTDNRLPILRVYFTSNKILVAKYSRVQEAQPVAVRLRVRAVGTIKCASQEETVNGPWSEEIWLSLEGSTVTGNTAM